MASERSISEQSILDLIKECNKDRTKTLAEFIADLFKDKFIEMYLGDSYEEISLEQTSCAYPAVFCGKVVAAYRECLVINSVFVNDEKKLQLGHLMFINERAIRGLNEVSDNGIIEDMFLRSKETSKIKRHFINHLIKKEI
jgi:hypothetical protein